MRAPLIAAVLAACGTSAQPTPVKPAGSAAEIRIRHAAEHIAEHPRVWANYVELAHAYLDRARETYDPRFVVKAQAATMVSLDILENIESYKTMAAIANYAHQFSEALSWCEKAQRLLSADVKDPELTGLLVEAYMGLGRYDEARKLLPPDGAPLPDYHSAASMAQWLKAQGRHLEAAAAFEMAARYARAADVLELVTWARIMAADAYLGAGDRPRARQHLDDVAAVDPRNRELRRRQAELLALDGRAAEALLVYEALLGEQPDAELHRRAFLLARERGDASRADRHFRAAEELLLRVVEGKQSYTLEELARLYLDAGTQNARALELAIKNLEIKRDRSATELVERARSALNPAGSSG